VRPSRALIALLALAATASQGPTPAGADFQVNTYTTGPQTAASVGVDPAGRFIIVWTSNQDADASKGIFGQRLDNGGAPLGGEFHVNTYMTGAQSEADVAADGMGNFVVTWDSYGQDGDQSGVFAQRYDAGGLPLGAEFQVNQFTTGPQRSPVVAADATGRFVVAWTGNYDVFARRFDAAGLPLGGEFQVNTYATNFQIATDVAVDGSGRAVIAWTGASASDTFGISARRYDAAGAPLGGEFQVNVHTAGAESAASVATDGSGRFLVAWQGIDVSDPDGADIFARGFDAGGLPLGGEFQVNTFATMHQQAPAVAVNAAGDFVVFWHSQDTTGSAVDAFGQRYDAAILPVGGEFRASAFPGYYATYPAAAVDAAGNFLVAWQSVQPSSSGFEIFAQRNKPDRLVFGSTFNVRAPGSTETQRSVSVLARETFTDVGRNLDGDPTSAGATLRVIANGATPSDQTFLLDASGWRAIANGGYRYTGPTGGDADPVSRVVVRVTMNGRVLIKARLRGGVGSQSLDVVPPNPGIDGGIILDIGNGGGRYCVPFGIDAAERRDTAQQWLLVNPVAASGCPS
jgi:hypothetical protein